MFSLSFTYIVTMIVTNPPVLIQPIVASGINSVTGYFVRELFQVFVASLLYSHNVSLGPISVQKA